MAAEPVDLQGRLLGALSRHRAGDLEPQPRPNELLRKRGIPEIMECTPHTLRRTYGSLLLAAGCDPAYVQQQVGNTDPTLTPRIYQQLPKRKRREGYRERVNDLLGTSPAALSKRPDLVDELEAGPNSGPNSLFRAT